MLKYLYCHSIQSLTSDSLIPFLMKGSSFISTPARASMGTWSQHRSCTSQASPAAAAARNLSAFIDQLKSRVILGYLDSKSFFAALNSSVDGSPATPLARE